MILSISEGKFSYGLEPILNNINITINPKDKIGFIGENGSGKSTLLKILLGQLTLDGGQLFKKSNLKMGYLEQNAEFSSELSILSEMEVVFKGFKDQIARQKEIGKEMEKVGESSENYKDLANELSKINQSLEHNDGYNYKYKIQKVLNGLGFHGMENQIVSTLSGGEKTRLLLCKLLLEENDLLILDEPTNHLDLDALSFLEDFLKVFPGAILMVSHDRYFLDKVTERIWELEDLSIIPYRGNYSKYKTLKEEETTLRLKEFERQQEEIKKLEDFVQKNIVRATSAKSAKSRVNKLERMEILTPPKITKPPTFRFSSPIDSVNDLLTVSGLDLFAGEKKLLGNLNFKIFRHERIAIVGKNGSGKSTLLKRLLKSANAFDPTCLWGKNSFLSYYDQEHKNLDPNLKVIDQLFEKFPQVELFTVRKLLGQMLFKDEDIDKKISSLSGGEKAKLSFAVIMGDYANTLLLDEPTNHLDLLSREGLETSLKNYEGSLLFVSHDRYFISQIATKILAIDDGISFFDSYEDYEKNKFKQTIEKEKTSKEESPQTKTYKNPKERQQEAKKRIRALELEKEIALLEENFQVLEREITLEEVYTSFELLQGKTSQMEEIKGKIDSLMSEWEECLS